MVARPYVDRVVPLNNGRFTDTKGDTRCRERTRRENEPVSPGGKGGSRLALMAMMDPALGQQGESADDSPTLLHLRHVLVSSSPLVL